MITLTQLSTYCMRKKGVSEAYPFDNYHLTFKVAGKIFLITDVRSIESINLKGTPQQNILLREEYPENILPGYHMNKKHWNTLKLDGVLPDKLVWQCIDASYDCVVQGLTNRQKKELE